MMYDITRVEVWAVGVRRALEWRTHHGRGRCWWMRVWCFSYCHEFTSVDRFSNRRILIQWWWWWWCKIMFLPVDLISCTFRILSVSVGSLCDLVTVFMWCIISLLRVFTSCWCPSHMKVEKDKNNRAVICSSKPCCLMFKTAASLLIHCFHVFGQNEMLHVFV